MRPLAALLLLGACAAPGTAVFVVSGNPLAVRALADEPQPLDPPATLPDGAPGYLPTAPLGAPGPALRVSGAITRPPALEAARRFCTARGGSLDGAPPMRFDDAAAEFVIYAAC